MPMNTLPFSESISYKLLCKEAAQYDLLTREEETLLAKKLKRGGKSKRQAVERFIEGNLRLVITIARGYTGMGLDIEDLVQEGNIGLMEAAKRYRSDKGAKFSTYSSLWIKQSIRRALSNKSRTIRVPTSAASKYKKVLEFKVEFNDEHGRDPTLKEVSKKLKTPAHRILSIANAMESIKPLDAPVSESGASSVHDFIPDPSVSPSLSAAKRDERKIILESMSSVLDERERFIILRRFGLDNAKRETLDSIGKKLRISRERVRQVQEVAMWKLKNSSVSKLS